MERLKQKLNSRRGASILMALLLMLVATMIAAVVVSASVTAVNRVNDDSGRQQGLLSVTSAARLVAKNLENVTCEKIVRTDHVYVPPVMDGDTVKEEGYTEHIVHDPEWSPSDGSTAGFFALLLRQIAEKADDGAYVAGDYSLRITPPDGTELSAAIFQFTLESSGDGFKMKDPVVYIVDGADGSGVDSSENKVWFDDITIDHSFSNPAYDGYDEEIDTWEVGNVKLMTQKPEG